MLLRNHLPQLPQLIVSTTFRTTYLPSIVTYWRFFSTSRPLDLRAFPPALPLPRTLPILWRPNKIPLRVPRIIILLWEAFNTTYLLRPLPPSPRPSPSAPNTARTVISTFTPNRSISRPFRRSDSSPKKKVSLVPCALLKPAAAGKPKFS